MTTPNSKKYQNMTDEDLIDSVVNPIKNNMILIDKHTGVIKLGNIRIYELRRRNLLDKVEDKVPYEIYDNGNSDYFYDMF